MLWFRTYSFQSKIAALIRNGKLTPDSAQEAAISALSALSDSLKQPRGFFSSRDRVKGVYIYGSVGSGKTMLMDMFYENCHLKLKQRLHFTQFMMLFHEQMRKYKSVKRVIKEYSLQARLLCLDEFQVTDIADAMILRRVLEELSAHDITLVTTSNRRPEGNDVYQCFSYLLDLYLNGIQRTSFLPCIEQIKNNMQVINLSSESDYRLRQELKQSDTPRFNQLCPDAKSLDLHILGRTINIPRGEIGKACEFTFQDLLVAPLSAADYLEICRNFPRVFITSLPSLDDTMRNELRRLITFVDICYEHRISIYFESPILPRLQQVQSELNASFDETFALNRTISRLAEMQTW